MAEGPTDWPTWLRSPREATHNNLTNSGARAAGQDLAEILGAQDVKAIEGKPLLPAWKPSPLPPAEARALSAREASTVRFATARGS